MFAGFEFVGDRLHDRCVVKAAGAEHEGDGIFSGVLGVGMVAGAFLMCADRRESRAQRRRAAGR